MTDSRTGRFERSERAKPNSETDVEVVEDDGRDLLALRFSRLLCLPLALSQAKDIK